MDGKAAAQGDISRPWSSNVIKGFREVRQDKMGKCILSDSGSHDAEGCLLGWSCLPHSRFTSLAREWEGQREGSTGSFLQGLAA